MSLSLVDYGSSSDSEDDDEQQKQQQRQQRQQPPPRQPLRQQNASGGLNQLLPPPKHIKTVTSTKKSIFYLPSAADIADEEDEKPSKRLKRGTASSNLTDLLPAPKNNLNPFRKYSSKAVHTTTAISSSPTQSNMSIPRSVGKTPLEINDESSNDGDNNDNSGDDDQDDVEEQEVPMETTSSKFTGSFFRIGSKLKEQPVIKSTTVPLSAVKDSFNTDDQGLQQQQQQQQQQQLPILEDPNAMYAFGADPNAYYQYYYQQQQQDDATNKETLDYDVLSQLGGKRRGENAGVNIIDVNQTDMLPSDEWRRQAEAQQPKLAATSAPATFDVNSAKKKKNNIMALAAQAKSMESTLEERYAQQRIAKNQARNRYGF